MSAPSPEEFIEAQRWLREAGEELAVAAAIAADPELPGRVSCFHAHLAAEKALKALQIRRGVLIRKVHNLVQLASQLPDEDQRRFDRSDLDLLNPWTIDGRYPADLGEVSQALVRRVGRSRARGVGSPPGSFIASSLPTIPLLELQPLSRSWRRCHNVLASWALVSRSQ